MIKKGTICIWQHCTGGKTRLNGSECTAMSNLAYITAGHKSGEFKLTLGYITDSHMMVNGYDVTLAAFPWELREKNPPQDELNLITEKEIENV